MSCPTCDHTVACIGIMSDGFATYWCSRCGSLCYNNDKAVDVPKLVERCRQFESNKLLPLLAVCCEVGKLWHRLGIAESINLPEARKT